MYIHFTNHDILEDIEYSVIEGTSYSPIGNQDSVLSQKSFIQIMRIIKIKIFFCWTRKYKVE